MNKYQEAYDYILTATNGGEGMVKEINIIRELVEKATPKKVIKKYTGYIKNSDDIKFDIYYHYCPNCNALFEGCDLGIKYCIECGQAIDWSNEG